MPGNDPQPLPTLSWLRAFEAAARHRSFTAAGGELGLTQAAISQQVRLLEARLGRSLFERLRRGVELTPDGAAYLPHVQSAFRAIAQTTAELFGSRSRQVIRLRCPISFAALWLAPRLPGFFVAFPATRVDIATIHAPGDYEAAPDGFDIRFGSGDFPGRTAHRMTSERLVPAVAATHLETDWDAGKGPWPDLPLLSVAGAREMWPDWLALSGMAEPRRPILRCDSFIVAYEAARSGAGILLASRPLVDRALERGELVRLSPIELTSSAGHFMTHPAGIGLSPEDQAFLGWWLRQASVISPMP